MHVASRVVAWVDSRRDPEPHIRTFNRSTGHAYDLRDDMAAAGAVDLRALVQIALIPPEALRKRLTQEELLERWHQRHEPGVAP